MTDTENARDLFRNPPNAYRPIAFWVWNDDLTPERAREQLRELAAHGFGGAFAHPRPGLSVEYLSDDWFALFQAALEEAERLGLQLSIYDENSYPSGFAGGHVPSELPDCLANCVHVKEYGPEELGELGKLKSLMLNVPGRPIRAFAMLAGTAEGTWTIGRDVTLLPVEEWTRHGERFWAFELGTPETNSWLGGFGYADLMRPEVTKRFLETTHEAYRERFGDKFGTVIPALFTDEPEISPGNLFQDGATFLPFTYWFAAEFEKRNGYAIFDYLPCLFGDAEPSSGDRDARSVRYDYYRTMHALWTDNSVRPISEWCERNGLAYTGHYVEHNWPHPFNRSSPSVMSMYEYMHWPAIDMLRSEMHRPDRKSPDNAAHMLVCIREAQSAANQFDRERVLCEAFGAGGWESSFEDYRRIGDWLFVHGINAMTPHLTYSSIAGARKRDHPQSFDWRQPWWEEWRTLAGYFARLSAALAPGRTRNRILVLNPTTSAYLFAPKDLGANEAFVRPFERTRELAQALADRGWDFDFGDEHIIGRHGSVKDGRFVVAERAYDVVVAPPATMNLMGATAALLARFMEEGGDVLASGASPTRLDGPAWDATSLVGHARWVRTDGIEALDAELRARLTPAFRWRSGRLAHPKLAALRREAEDGGATLFLANSAAEPWEDVLLVPGARAERWDPLTGDVSEIGSAADGVDGTDGTDGTIGTGGIGGLLAIPVRLPGAGSLLLRLYNEAAEATVTGVVSRTFAETGALAPLAAGEMTVEPEDDNMLPILYCDLTIGGRTYAGVSALQAGKLAYEHHGFPSNPWDNGIQFKRRLLDRESSFDERTGIAVDYRFRVLPGALPPKLGLVVERPELYRVTVNGHPVTIINGTYPLDAHMGQADIAGFAREGDNVVRLEGRPFSIRMEIEAIYVTGDFGVVQDNGEWAIARQQPLRAGAWRKQGYPFYAGAMRYRRTANVPESAGRTIVRLPDWRGSVATVFVDGTAAGLIGLDRGDALDVTDFVVPGAEHEIAVRVAGGFRNLLGPHFEPSKPRNVAWPTYWKSAPALGPPPADRYDLLDYGLMTGFVVEAETKETKDR